MNERWRTMFILLLALLATLTFAQNPPGQWQKPYFISMIPEKITVGEYDSVVREQPISMWEEIDYPYKMVQLNYQGSDIQIRLQPAHLGAQLERTDDKWYITITNRLDYEQLAHRMSMLVLVVEGDVKQTISVPIQLVNILDNVPVMFSEGPCDVEEHRTDFLSNCSYTVNHKDGFIPNEIEGKYTNRLEFVIPEAESQFFVLAETEQPDSYNKKFRLRVLKALDYTQQALFNFPTTVYDLNRTHNFTMNLVVQVRNVESRSPIFTRPFTTQRILEKTAYETLVTAIDGDTGLNQPVCYDLRTQNETHAKYFQIDPDETGKNGVLKVAPINRDAEKNEFYQFTIFAYKCHNRDFIVSSDAAIILDDINDNIPVFDVEPRRLAFWENTLMELPFEKFNVEDIDLGIHATYDLSLRENVSNTLLPEADSFSIIPKSGYQLSTFTLTIVNTSKLDYELPERQQFELIATATEVAEASHSSRQVVTIELLNWNDEVPAFDKETYEISIEETIGKDEKLVTVHITDRDVDDSVDLKILSRIGDDLNVIRLNNSDEMQAAVPTFSFQIRTGRDEIFDWDVATEVLVQLQATDTLQTDKHEPLHQVYAQVVITVLDVNNKPPSITLPRGRIHIAENSEPNTAATIGDEEAIIIGTDPDTTADLEFSIDWKATYGVKAGVPVTDIFEDCLVFDVDATNPNRVLARIRVNPELDQETINKRLDYEAYETLFLTVRLVDKAQVIPPNDTEAIVVLQIDDVNDNPPIFIDGTLEVERFVMEEAETGTIVGSISAIDIDGPEFNKIYYSIAAKNPDQEGLISIDPMGMLFVNATKLKIGCDVPITYDIPLLITLTDGLFVTNGSIKINITDTNNKFPTFKAVPSEVKIFEKSSSGTEIVRLEVDDLDRDEVFHTVAFEIDLMTFPDLQNYFEVNRLANNSGERLQQTGVVFVKENNRILDRDSGTDRFTITVKVRDNPNSSGRRNTEQSSFTLILLDINDQQPVMPQLEGLKVSEDAHENDVILQHFEATDRDDRNTPNAKIHYRIEHITAAGGNSPGLEADPERIGTLFKLQPVDEYVSRLEVGHTLKGFYGSWSVEIEACDRGNEYELIKDSPRWCSSATYLILVEPVNYMAPVIVFPRDDERIRLSFESLANGKPLLNTQGETIPHFGAHDTDGGDFGVVTFYLQSQDPFSQDHTYFQLNPVDKHHAQLVLAQADAIGTKSYRVTVHARDGGNLSAEPVDVVIAFINMTGEPEFHHGDLPFETDFTENEDGMLEERIIPAAIDPKNAELPPDEQKAIFYFIDVSYGNASHLFQLNEETRILRLTQELDREEIPSHEIRVIATNNINGPTGPVPADSRSLLIVRIKVNDVNDNPPVFRQRSYSAGITTNDYKGKILFVVIADDPDEDDVVSYTIEEGSLEVHGENLPTVPFPFELASDSGQLSLAVEIKDRMNGFYTFTIVARDLVFHNDTVPAKIYLIVESNRVKFVFVNPVEDINTPEMRSFLESQFSAHYELECNIDDVVRGSIDGDGRAAGDMLSDVRAHFIRDNEAVEAIEIQQRSNDRVFVANLKRALSEKQLLLQDVPVTSVEFLETKSEILQIILIVIASALALICVIMLVAFCMKMRSMNRQLKALSTDFGSIASDLNGGRKVPTTNIFSVEGSNPVLTDKEFLKGAFDDVSVQSYESDFVGIDNDMFTNKKRESLNPALVDHVRQRSLNPMANREEASTSKAEPKAAENNDELSYRF
ncbi:protocadherin Fat 1-like [Toxorhynchites rutilus septentrionalis]|uniref:protocadherin Fat 1-like n=1 Tax=Toxorhynchites rutilus septentrionalis TaxID=329112 RepID=UPI00247A3101|nr:protocadherin Fat 1-like [Toxorhynchites rutilus septentrionalis]